MGRGEVEIWTDVDATSNLHRGGCQDVSAISRALAIHPSRRKEMLSESTRRFSLSLGAGVALFLFSSQTFAQVVCTTTVSGGPVGPATWTLADSPYCVEGDINVSLLIIEPGVGIAAVA